MKRTILLLSALILSCHLMAQPDIRRNEFAFGIGYAEGITNMFSGEKIIEYILRKDWKSTNDKKHSGLYLSYKYHFNSRWALGTTLTHKGKNQEGRFNEERSKYAIKFYGVNLEGQYTYYNHRIIRMYALAGAGVYTCKEKLRTSGTKNSEEKETTTGFTYQVSPLCVEVGTYVGIKAEVGYGYKGIIGMGLYYRF
ncbi:outer membrane beta-barrel protein [Phocaeicola sp.]